MRPRPGPETRRFPKRRGFSTRCHRATAQSSKGIAPGKSIQPWVKYEDMERLEGDRYDGRGQAQAPLAFPRGEALSEGDDEDRGDREDRQRDDVRRGGGGGGGGGSGIMLRARKKA